LIDHQLERADGLFCGAAAVFFWLGWCVAVRAALPIRIISGDIGRVADIQCERDVLDIRCHPVV
jgi:hypothetical protein